jgi:hypothetical protein
MRTVSTRQSVENGEITIVALCETALAMSISAGLALYFETLFHLAVGACAVPLLLLKSTESAHLAVRLFERGLPRKPRSDDPFTQSWVYLRVLIWSSLVRILSNLRYPVKGLQSLPDNWKRLVMCTDIGSPIEFVPGSGPIEATLRRVSYEGDQQSWSFLLFGVVISASLSALGVGVGSWLSVWQALPFTLPSFTPIHILTLLFQYVTFIFTFVFVVLSLIFALGLFCYVVVHSYRLSLKSTALLWLPLVYVARSTFDDSLDLRKSLHEIRVSALWKLIRLLSWLTLVLLGAKVVILPGVIDWWNSRTWTRVLNVYVMPNEIHPWHVAAGFNAALALGGYYLFLERAERFLRAGAWPEPTVDKTLRLFRFARGIVSAYTISVGIYLTITAARVMAWPKWSGKIFPWL